MCKCECNRCFRCRCPPAAAASVPEFASAQLSKQASVQSTSEFVQLKLCRCALGEHLHLLACSAGVLVRQARVECRAPSEHPIGECLQHAGWAVRAACRCSGLPPQQVLPLLPAAPPRAAVWQPGATTLSRVVTVGPGGPACSVPGGPACSVPGGPACSVPGGPVQSPTPSQRAGGGGGGQPHKGGRKGGGPGAHQHRQVPAASRGSGVGGGGGAGAGEASHQLGWMGSQCLSSRAKPTRH